MKRSAKTMVLCAVLAAVCALGCGCSKDDDDDKDKDKDDISASEEIDDKDDKDDKDNKDDKDEDDDDDSPVTSSKLTSYNQTAALFKNEALTAITKLDTQGHGIKRDTTADVIVVVNDGEWSITGPDGVFRGEGSWDMVVQELSDVFTDVEDATVSIIFNNGRVVGASYVEDADYSGEFPTAEDYAAGTYAFDKKDGHLKDGTLMGTAPILTTK